MHMWAKRISETPGFETPGLRNSSIITTTTTTTATAPADGRRWPAPPAASGEGRRGVRGGRGGGCRPLDRQFREPPDQVLERFANFVMSVIEWFADLFETLVLLIISFPNGCAHNYCSRTNVSTHLSPEALKSARADFFHGN